MLAQPDDATDDENASAPIVRRFHGRDDGVERTDDRFLLGQGAAENEGRGLVGRASVAEERLTI